MDAIINPRRRYAVASACRLIRGRWDREERRQRRRIAHVKQRELWQLLKVASSRSAKKRHGMPGSAYGAQLARLSGATDGLCSSS
jgi:hypothetical protein